MRLPCSLTSPLCRQKWLAVSLLTSPAERRWTEGSRQSRGNPEASLLTLDRFHTQTWRVSGPTQSPEEAPVPKRGLLQNLRLLLQPGDGTVRKGLLSSGKNSNVSPQCGGWGLCVQEDEGAPENLPYLKETFSYCTISAAVDKRPCPAALTCWVASWARGHRDPPGALRERPGGKGPAGLPAPPSHLQMKELWV